MNGSAGGGRVRLVDRRTRNKSPPNLAVCGVCGLCMCGSVVFTSKIVRIFAQCVLICPYCLILKGTFLLSQATRRKNSTSHVEREGSSSQPKEIHKRKTRQIETDLKIPGRTVTSPKGSRNKIEIKMRFQLVPESDIEKLQLPSTQRMRSA